MATVRRSLRQTAVWVTAMALIVLTLLSRTDVTGWFAFFVPARTSRGIVEKIHIDTVTALSDPTVKAKLENVGMVAIGSTPEELAELLKAETEKWSAVIKEADIALD